MHQNTFHCRKTLEKKLLKNSLKIFLTPSQGQSCSVTVFLSRAGFTLERDWNKIIMTTNIQRAGSYHHRYCIWSYYSQSPDLRHVIETGNRNAGDVVIVESTVGRKRKRTIDWSVICISSPPHYLEKQAAKTLCNKSTTLRAVGPAERYLKQFVMCHERYR